MDETNPFGLARLQMKFELAGRTVSALEELEECKCLKLDSAQTALMCSSHINTTILWV